jgi:hypothetical protein
MLSVSERRINPVCELVLCVSAINSPALCEFLARVCLQNRRA